MHVVLLRLALGLYSLGFAHAVLTALKKKQTFFKPALAATVAGFILQVASIVLRAMDVHYLPLTQQYEAFSFFGALATLGFLIAYAKYRIAPLSVFAFPLIFIMTFVANLYYDPSSSIPPVLRSNWIYIHTPLVFLGYAALFIGFAAAVMYLIQEHMLKAKHLNGLYHKLPALDFLDELNGKAISLGFPLLTLPASALGKGRGGFNRRIIAPIAFIPISLTVRQGPTPTVELSCRGDGVDLVCHHLEDRSRSHGVCHLLDRLPPWRQQPPGICARRDPGSGTL